MMEGANIIKLKKTCIIFLIHIYFNVRKFQNNVTHHFSIEIFNLYYKLSSLLILIHIDCLIHQFSIFISNEATFCSLGFNSNGATFCSLIG